MTPPPTPFVTSIYADFASIEHRTHIRAVHASPSRDFLRFRKKVVFLAFFRQCRPAVLLLAAAKQLKIGSVCKGVRSDIFFSTSCSANTSIRRASWIRNTPNILTWREKLFSKTWRHPNNFSRVHCVSVSRALFSHSLC